MKRLFIYLFLAFVSANLMAQVAPSGQRHKMAVFTPLYLDDVFNSQGAYRFNTKSFPKNSINGLEFYHGVSMAIDSLNRQNVPLDIYVYDSKSGSETLEQQFSKCAADGVELIIANTSLSELGRLAKLAADKKITLVNATVPNDANTTNNPYFVMVNPTLGTQIEGLYKHIKSNYPAQDVVFFTHKGGSSEDYIKGAFDVLNSGADPIKIKYVQIGDTAAVSRAIYALDPAKPALFVSGSLDNTFGGNVISRAATASNIFSKVVVFGMPTWENLSMSKADYKGVEIVYGTPFYRSGNSSAASAISNSYNKKMFARPSDLVYRAFGLTYRFGQLLNQYGKNINQNLGNKSYPMFYDYNIQPVYQNGNIGYYENKKLYFLRYLNGSLQQVM
ncbi:MAG: hypothetical protein BGN92_02060 [Sphingobacteriales bacterium 41-5]|nr:MAG: hypothetical protein BGN92_02060 [Sphingobacteriales bacterium 41-5]